MPATFGPREQARLAHILARLESPFENERAIAGLLATAFLKRHGLTWSDLSALSHPVAEPPPAREPRVPRAKQERRRIGLASWAGYCRRRARSNKGQKPLNVVV